MLKWYQPDNTKAETINLISHYSPTVHQRDTRFQSNFQKLLSFEVQILMQEERIQDSLFFCVLPPNPITFLSTSNKMIKSCIFSIPPGRHNYNIPLLFSWHLLAELLQAPAHHLTVTMLCYTLVAAVRMRRPTSHFTTCRQTSSPHGQIQPSSPSTHTPPFPQPSQLVFEHFAVLVYVARISMQGCTCLCLMPHSSHLPGRFCGYGHTQSIYMNLPVKTSVWFHQTTTH